MWLEGLRRRYQVILVLFLCGLAMGSQWELLQVFAWGRMMVNYARSESVTRAVTDTFDGQMCGICRLVENARKQAQSQPQQSAPNAETKVILFFQSVPLVVVEAPKVVGRIANGERALSRDRAMPPVPPPRLGLAQAQLLS